MRTADTESIPVRPILLWGSAAAVVLALAVSGRTYVSMLNHGHSFSRLFVWQLLSSSAWLVAAPWIMQAGARFVPLDRRAWFRGAWLVALGVVVVLTHRLVVAVGSAWMQPFAPVQTDTVASAFALDAPYLVMDAGIYVALLVGGVAVQARAREQRLALRESRLEAELARAQLYALRLEIEPHFLFNTLNAIAALIRLKDHGRALEMLVELSDFMRLSLDRPRDQFVPLATELDWIERYVHLHQTRFGERLAVTYDVAAECLGVSIPACSLQPIVENALRHGAARQAARCRIEIAANVDERRLTVSVADDGAGLPSNFDLERHAGTGLRNVRARLEQLYGDGATLAVVSRQPAGTLVRLTVPVADAPVLIRATA
jgi:signal transduction histidine kinase